MTKFCGIYRIEINRGPNKPLFYIGQSIDIAERRMSHLRALRAGRHDNTHMLNAFRKYGEQSFIFQIMLICGVKDLCLYEQTLLDWHRAVYGLRVVNVMTECVRSPIGVKRRPETVQRMSLSQKGRRKPPEIAARLSVAMLGRKHSEATKQKLSEYHKGRERHPNSLAALESTRNTTRIKRLRETICGKPKIHSEETKQKIAASLRGRTSTPEANEKRRLAQLGRKCSAESIAKRVASRLANAAKKAETAWSQSKGVPP